MRSCDTDVCVPIRSFTGRGEVLIGEAAKNQAAAMILIHCQGGSRDYLFVGYPVKNAVKDAGSIAGTLDVSVVKAVTGDIHLGGYSGRQTRDYKSDDALIISATHKL